MAEYNINPINNALQPVIEATEEINKALLCDWDDEVHESYEQYHRDCKTAVDELSSIVRTLNNECATLSSIDVDGMIESARSLCGQIEGI